MKFKISFKDPDSFDDALIDLLTTKDTKIDYFKNISCDEAMQDKRHKLIEFLQQWVRYEQYIDVEFDTESNTATVIKREKIKDESLLPI